MRSAWPFRRLELAPARRTSDTSLLLAPEMDDIPELRDLFLGDAGIQPSLANFWLFCTRCYEIIGATWAAEHNCPDGSCPQGSPEREAGKQRFTNLVRENMWIASLLGALYVLFVTFVPRMIKKPLPLGRVLQLWNLSLAVFSAFGAYHCFGALWANVSTAMFPCGQRVSA